MEFNDFLLTVDPQHRSFAQEIHKTLTDEKFKITIESKAQGFLVVYKHPTTKKSLLNFYFRKSGLHIRLYPSHDFSANTFNPSAPTDFSVRNTFNPSALTDYMKSEIDKQPNCKPLTGAGNCSAKCAKGYEFNLNSKHYQKCRLCAFQFLVTDESKGILKEWVGAEVYGWTEVVK